jgi:hypothetical protein
VIEAIFEGMPLKGKRKDPGSGLFDEIADEVELQWQSAKEREKRSRTLFAQESIKVDEVVRELQATRDALGSGVDVAGFVRAALTACGGAVAGDDPARVSLKEVPRALRDQLDLPDEFAARFDPATRDGELYLSRTHPAVEALAAHVLNAALDPLADGPARRCGVIRTARVARRTTLLLLRHRFHIVGRAGDGERQLLAEDAHLVAFEGSPQNPTWLPADATDRLPEAEPDGNVTPDQARDFLQRVLDGLDLLRPRLIEYGHERGEQLLDAHRRVRQASKARSAGHRVEAQDAPDLLGVFVYLPKAV